MNVPTFTATIYCGRRVGYSDHVAPMEVVEQVLKRYCDEASYCVSVTPTQFVYKQGREPGVIVGLINYPRFPEEPAAIEARALEIAGLLKDALKQNRVTVVFPTRTVMIGD